jgi:hypothetical protein
VFGYDYERALAAAGQIIQNGGWCVLEVCVDIPRQRWEPRVVIFDLSSEAVASEVAQQIDYEPARDARLAACDRRTLRREPGAGAYLCYVAPPHLTARQGRGSIICES